MTVITKADRHYKGQQLLWSARERNALMFQIKFTERNRTCCRFLFFWQIDCSDCFEVVQGTFSNGKAWGRDRVEKCDVTLPWLPNFWISTILLDRDSHLHYRNDGRSHNNAQESRTFHTIHVRFFLSNLQDGICWIPKVLFPWHRRVFSIVQGAVSWSSCELSSTPPCV